MTAPRRPRQPRRSPTADGARIEAARRAIALADEVPRHARANLESAARLAVEAGRLARRSRDGAALARALRAQGHVCWFRADYRAADRCYARAITMFERQGDHLQLAITLSGSLQTLIYLGRYARAHARARRARAMLRRLGDRARLARLESNIGNIFYRQDQFDRAIGCYERAATALRELGEHHDVALALRNMAVCLVSLHRFDRALAVHQEARDYGSRHDMRLFVAETDYNIAYLYFLRGEYERAVELYSAARQHCDQVGDAYHRSLCDLDQAELCLELNDYSAARRLADIAASGFRRLAMRYERAKALTFLAAAEIGHGDLSRGLTTFQTARALFVADGNRPWAAAVDLARASSLYHAGRRDHARRLVGRSTRRSWLPPMSMRRVLWDLLRARLDLAEGRARSALALARAAVTRVSRARGPALEWQAHHVLGEAHEACGALHAAEQSYQRARRSLNGLWAQLGSDALKVLFLTDKRAVYERLFVLTAARGGSKAVAEAAFQIAEEAKSRSLADLMAFRSDRVPTRAKTAEASARVVRSIGQDVRAVAHQLVIEELQATADTAKLRRLRSAQTDRSRVLSAALVRLRLADPELASLQAGDAAGATVVRAALPPGTALIDYYEADGSLFCVLLQRDDLRVVRLAPVDQVLDALALLRFQLAKFRLGPDYLRTFSSALMAAALHHLHDLHGMLLAPLLPFVRATSLVIVPHGQLHYLPFHALFDGRHHVIDDYVVSYAPSATVYGLCQSKPPSAQRGSLVLALDDAFAPHIAREAQEVARLLPDARLYTGTDATVARLAQDVPSARYAHIATHGVFRRDNPMLSAIRLADGDVTLADLYALSIDADLVTLSGCGTGLSAVVGGDELVGLTRGLLFAGARSLLLTMWQVDDFSTAEFMGHFYRRLAEGAGKAAAVADAMKAVRRQFSHPYYWAPFVLVGQSGAEELTTSAVETVKAGLGAGRQPAG